MGKDKESDQPKARKKRLHFFNPKANLKMAYKDMMETKSYLKPKFWLLSVSLVFSIHLMIKLNIYLGEQTIAIPRDQMRANLMNLSNEQLRNADKERMILYLDELERRKKIRQKLKKENKNI